MAASLMLLVWLAMPGSARAAGAWSIQNPTTASLTSTDCASASTCWAVGAQGTIVVTTDGGVTWRTQSSGTRNNLNGIACTTATQCIVVGDKAGAGTNAVVLTTADGGSTWSTQNSGTGNNLHHVACPAQNACLAVGRNGTILKSTNSGVSWSAQVSFTTSQLNAIACPTSSKCVVVGNKSGPGTNAAIVTTSDGGTNWSAVTSTTTNDLKDVACASTLVCRAVGQAGTILATSDGGATWSGQTSGTTQPLQGVSCPAATTCRAVGGAGTIVATGDGSTWSAQSSGKTVPLNAVACVDSTTCRAVGGSGAIVKTADGSTWQSETSGSSAPLREISCVSSTTCWAVGGQGVVLTTSNAGGRWLQQSSGVTKQLNGVACVGFGTCYAVGANNGPGTNALIVKTVNGGASWSIQDSNVTGQLWGVACKSATTCWAVGDGGAIAATTDGTSWIAQTSGVTKPLKGIACLTTATCFIAGAANGPGTNGIVLKTANAGTTWAQQNSNLTADLNAVACASIDHCWVAGQGGKLAATTDGSSWAAQGSTTTANLNGLACATTTACWAVGSNAGPGQPATIVTTTDGGSTWFAQPANTTSNLNGVAFASTSYGWAVGDSGTVAAYLDDSVPPAAPDIGSSPVSPGSATSIAWSFTGEAGATFECRLERGGTAVVGWSPCVDEGDYDLSAQPDGTYTFLVRATDAAGNTGPSAQGDYVLDTAAPAAPAIAAAPAPITASRSPSWSFSGEAGARFECRLDSGSTQVFDWGDCTSAKTYALIAQPDGAYRFSVRAIDAAGNASAAATDDFTLDTTAPAAPTITGTTVTPNASRSPSWSFTGESGATLECRLDRGSTQIAGWSSCSFVAGYDLAGDPDGSYTFSVRATDAGGNVGAAATSTYVLDTAAPAAPALTSTPASPASNTSPSWSFSGESGASFECSLDPSGTGPTWSPCSSPQSFGLSGKPDGTYTFAVRAIDSAGNAGPATTNNYALDSAAPTAPTIGSGPPASGATRTPSWTFAAPGATSYECRLAPGSDPSWGWQPCASGKSYDLTGASDGTYTFSVRAKDGAANTSAATDETYRLDTAAPNPPTFVSQPASPGNDLHPTWSLNSEAGATLQCRLLRGATLISQWTCGTTATADLSGQADGTLTLSVVARDAAGNASAPATRDYDLDTAGPATSIGSPPATPGSGRHPSWAFSAEAGATYSCRVADAGVYDSGWGACTSPDAVDLTGRGDGLYTFYVRATDTAGNTGPVSTSDYLLDTAAPAAPTISSAPGSPGRSRAPSWSFTADAGAAVSCRLDQGSSPLFGWAPCSGNVSYDLSGSPDATYNLSLRATDAAGNQSPLTTRAYSLDTTAPAPPTLAGTPPAAGSDTSPSWSFSGEPAATFECRLDRGVTPFSGWASCSGSIGYDLTGEPDGTFTFSVRATDSVGNVGTPRTGNYQLDTSMPAAPAWISEPAAVASSSTPGWVFGLPSGTTAECRVDRGSNVVFGWSACASPYSVNLAGQTDGMYTLLARAVNGVGTRGAVASSAYTLDTQAPAAPTFLAKPSPIGADPTPSWSFSAEPGATVQCRLDSTDAVISDWGSCASPYGASLVGKADGTYAMSVRATDAAGNTGAAAHDAYQLLTSVPGAPVITASPGPIGQGRHVTWSFNGTAGDTFECRLTRESAVASDWTACAAAQSFDLAWLPDGAYNFAVRARNPAGTVGATSTSTYLLDTEAPARPSVTKSPPRVDNDRMPTWSFTGESDATIQCRVRELGGGADWHDCADPHTANLRDRDDGNYVFELRAADAAGNVSPTLTKSYELDTTPPAAPELSSTPGPEGSDLAPTWAFRGEADASFECQVDRPDDPARDWKDCTSPQRYHVAADALGKYAFSVRATDAAGNTGSVTASSYRLRPSSDSGSGTGPGAAPEPGPGPGPGPGPAADEPSSADPQPAPATPPGTGPADRGGATSTKPRAGRQRARQGNSQSPHGASARAARDGHGSHHYVAPSTSRHHEDARSPLGKGLAFAGKAAVKVAAFVAKNPDKTVFPLSLLVVVGLFLLVQGRIDRNDPKLALAPLVADTQIEFGPALRLRGLEIGPTRADTRRDPAHEEGPV